MSRNGSEHLTTDTLAFDYVCGVLRGKQRDNFEVLRRENPEIQAQVQFWEEQLMHLSDASSVYKPLPNTWAAIEQRIVKSVASKIVKPSVLIWQKWLLWLTPSVITAMVVSGLFLYIPRLHTFTPSADYVAVLTTPKGEPLLSALTASHGNLMWLKWENLPIGDNKSLQLWAISKRDGQIRPISVFDHMHNGEISISKASLHLIKEAASLMLTEEELGGSPLDEPSDIILAKGACVLLNPEQKTI